MSSLDPAQFPVDLEPGEQLLKAGSANMQRGAETVGGKLYLTTARLAFVPHGLNVQTATSQIMVGAIAETRSTWTKVLGAIPVAPNSFEVLLYDGAQHSFVVMSRRAWIAAIGQARGGGVPVG